MQPLKDNEGIMNEKRQKGQYNKEAMKMINKGAIKRQLKGHCRDQDHQRGNSHLGYF